MSWVQIIMSWVTVHPLGEIQKPLTPKLALASLCGLQTGVVARHVRYHKPRGVFNPRGPV